MIKEAQCIDCGKIIYINKRASNKTCRCEECKRNHNIEIKHNRYHNNLIKKHCLYCGNEYYGNNNSKFCSRKCSRLYDKNNNNNIKETKCIDCGKIIYVNKRISDTFCRCEECKSKQKNDIIKKCKICGSLYSKNIDHICQNNFCQHHNIQQFKTLIKYFGFDQNKLGTLDVENEFNRIRDLLYDLYWNKGYSSEDLGKLFKYKNTNHIVQDIFVYMNIPKRNLSEANKNAILNPNKFINKLQNNNYKCQWHTTWNNKEVYLRSSYELDYAKELDIQKIDYEVEFKRIKYWDSQRNEYRCAIPDFYIPSQNLIIEIKSSWTLDKQNMKDKIKAYKDLGYNFKLICDYNEIQI